MNPAIRSQENTAANFLILGCVLRMAESQRLKQAPDAVAQMHAHQNHRDDVETGRDRIAEAIDDIFIRMKLDELRMNRSRGEVEQMPDDEMRQ